MSSMVEAKGNGALAGISVFVVEDEALVALNLESMLEDLGCRVVGPAMRFEQAMAMATADAVADVAVLDVNLGGRQVFPIAEELRARAVPFLFATGYGRSGIPEPWHDCIVLQKPYTQRELAAALEDLRR